jgi:large subunit ribosomal protein L25
MAEQATLAAEKREVKGTSSAKKLRREGVVPAVVYGSKQRPYPIQVKENAFAEVFRTHSSANFLLNLEIAGANEKTKLAFVQEIQRNPLTGGFVHIDFRAVQEDEIITAVVPVVLEGDCVGVKAGGLLEHLLHSLEIHCHPGDLPEKIVHDVTEVGLAETVKVSQLKLPKGVTTKMDGDVLVGLVAKSRASISAAAAAPAVEKPKAKPAAKK